MSRSESLSYRNETTRPAGTVLQPPAVLQELVQSAGVAFNGPSPWDIQVHDDRLYSRILRQGSLGFGEAYMDGWWDCQRLDELFLRLLRADINDRLSGIARLRYLLTYLKSALINRQSKRRAAQVGEHHYDIGNDVFEAMLDPTMSYSCGYWEHAASLAEAQRDKLRMSCEKLRLEPGQRLLDIGCGWGGLAQFAAQHYGVEVTGITISKEQKAFAEERCRGLPVSIELMDYRDLTGRYDRIISIGMFEHVGPKNYCTYFGTVERLLEDQGLFLLHTIGCHRTFNDTDEWMDKYIFPNGKLPSAKEVVEAVEPYLLIDDWHSFGQDYDRTLMAWWDSFDAAWPRLSQRHSERFYRMWKYYLHCCAGFFRARNGLLWQLVMSKRQRRSVYRSIR